MEASPQLTLMPLLLSLFVLVAAANHPTVKFPAGYDPQKLCAKTPDIVQCFGVLENVPGAYEAPDYRALALLLERHAVEATKGDNVLAAAMGTQNAVHVDPCLKSCFRALGAFNGVLSLCGQLPNEDERLWDLRTNLTSFFRSLAPEPPACTGGCPHIPHTRQNALVVGKFIYVWSVMNFLEVVLDQVYPLPVEASQTQTTTKTTNDYAGGAATAKTTNEYAAAAAAKTTGPNY